MENGSEQNNQTLVLDGHGGTDQALSMLLAETISQVGRAKRLSKAANCTSKARCHCSQTGKKKKTKKNFRVRRTSNQSLRSVFFS